MTYITGTDIDYLDVPGIMNEKYPQGYAPLDLYTEIVPRIDKVETGKYDVLVLDNASPLEEVHAAYVEKFPQKFGLSPNQLDRSGGLKWGAVKNLYFQNITRWSAKFKMVFIIVQLRDKWAGNSVVKDEFGNAVQEPRGKDTLDMLASLFVWLEAGPGGVPAANVLKCRIDRKIFIADPKKPPKDVPEKYLGQLNGEPGLVSIPVLPLRLPKCTWPAIREYMRNPADLVNPGLGETPSKKAMNEDDRLRLRSIIAQNEAAIAEAEKLKMQQLAEKERAAKKQAFLRTAAALGYKLPNGAPDVDRIKTILTQHGLYPYSPENEAEALAVLKNGGKGE